MWLHLAPALLLILSPACLAGNHYWWMNNPSVFSSGNQGGSSQGSGSGSYGAPSQNLQVDSQDDSYVETECPVGTKCVADNFCNEDAVMVGYRVDLSIAQKRKRGKLIPCVTSGNGEFGVCCSTASSPASNTFAAQNNVKFSGNLVQPNNNQQQQQTSFSSSSSVTIPTGECPNIAALPPVESCSQKTSNCWSVGQADVDCPNNALCCFDGCVNACYFGGSSTASSTSSFSSSPPAQNNFQSSSFQPAPQPTSFQSSSPVVFQDSTYQESVPAVPEPVWASDPEPNPPAFQTPAPVVQTFDESSYSAPQADNTYIPPPPVVQQPPTATYTQPQNQGPRQNTFVSPAKPQQPQQQQFNQPRKQQSQFNNQRQQTTNFESAETKPFVTCPSAMKCVPRVNCDFNGVMTDQTLNLTPDLEMLRVPLIPCVNPMTTNIDVCCRDPNYTDPWPDMGNNGNGNGGNFGGNGNAGQFNGNQNNGNFGSGSSPGIAPRISGQDNQQVVRKPSGYGK